MFVHAEEFDNRRAARARYLEITGRLRAERDRDLGCYNLLYQSTRPVVAIIAPEAPPACHMRSSRIPALRTASLTGGRQSTPTPRPMPGYGCWALSPHTQAARGKTPPWR